MSSLRKMAAAASRRAAGSEFVMSGASGACVTRTRVRGEKVILFREWKVVGKEREEGR